MTTPGIPAKMVKDGETKGVFEMGIVDAFRTRICQAAENLRWTRGYEDLQYELYHHVLNYWLKGILHADKLAMIEVETRRRSITARLGLLKHVAELQQAGDFRGIAHHFPTVYPDINNKEDIGWHLTLTTPLRFVDSWDQASNSELTRWVRHSESLRRLDLACPTSATANTEDVKKAKETWTSTAGARLN